MNEEQVPIKIFGDESGVLGANRFFAIGILGTEDVDAVVRQLKLIRAKASYRHEISYKSGDRLRALCALKWMDWFFGGQSIVRFKIIIKDMKSFSVSYYKDNAFDTQAATLAYCQSYAEVIRNFADFNDRRKILIYSRISLAGMEIAKYLGRKVPGLHESDCHEGHCDEKTKDGVFTGNAEMLQLADLLTGSTRGLCCSLYKEESAEDWVKNTLRKNIDYHLPGIKDRMKTWENFYDPAREPPKDQRFNLYMWRSRY